MRIFAALPLPKQAVEKLEQLTAELKRRYPDLKVVKPHGMHITMVFFGELNQDQVLAIMRIMDNPALKVASIQAIMGGVGQFPPTGRPRVIYCPISKGIPEIGHLYRLYYRLVSGIEGLSLEAERDFTPHITLARNRLARLGVAHTKAGRTREGRISLSDVEELFRFEYSLILDRLVLYQSILRPQGAEYKVMKTVILG
ncbi:MAG: RNA 2',3'-cyclic phosphodiesterase [Spirochaetaceae bacterium]|nr:MAG: RNA 2',3'-cyclic phosphodiesterase [Spirochaetaceae bacterium]